MLNPGLDLTWFGRDFRIYRDAGLALVNGTDPWSAFDHWNGSDWHFAALPTAAQAFVPFAFIPEGIGLAVFLGATLALGVLSLRRLGLPVWWLLFPPVMEGLAAANPQILLFGLLLVGGPLARAVAVALKVYAIVPIVARMERRALLAVGLAIAASVLIGWPLWATYLGRFNEIGARVARESNGGVSAALVLDPKVFGTLLGGNQAIAWVAGIGLFGLIAGLVLLVAIRDVRSAGWLAVPLLWPATEYPAGVFALPIARRLSTWIIAMPLVPTYLLGLIVLAYEVTAGRPAIVRERPPVPLRQWITAWRRPYEPDDTFPRTES